MSEPRILQEKRDGALWLIINRPEVRNALDPQTWMEIQQALTDGELDNSVSVLVITGSGDRVFASGADIRSLRERTPEEILSSVGQRVMQSIPELAKPVIAAINGDALGGGCELAMACDLRIAVETARLGLPEVMLGVIPSGGGTQRLVPLVGLGRALEMAMTGEPLSAGQAASIGLVNRIATTGQLVQAVDALTQTLKARGPLAVRMAKAAIHFAASPHMHSGLHFERLAQAFLFTSEDRMEGINAFLEKRTPNFTGK